MISAPGSLVERLTERGATLAGWSPTLGVWVTSSDLRAKLDIAKAPIRISLASMRIKG